MSVNQSESLKTQFIGRLIGNVNVIEYNNDNGKHYCIIIEGATTRRYKDIGKDEYRTINGSVYINVFTHSLELVNYFKPGTIVEVNGYLKLITSKVTNKPMMVMIAQTFKSFLPSGSNIEQRTEEEIIGYVAFEKENPGLTTRKFVEFQEDGTFQLKEKMSEQDYQAYLEGKRQERLNSDNNNNP